MRKPHPKWGAYIAGTHALAGWGLFFLELLGPSSDYGNPFGWFLVWAASTTSGLVAAWLFALWSRGLGHSRPGPRYASRFFAGMSVAVVLLGFPLIGVPAALLLVIAAAWMRATGAVVDLSGPRTEGIIKAVLIAVGVVAAIPTLIATAYLYRDPQAAGFWIFLCGPLAAASLLALRSLSVRRLETRHTAEAHH